MSFRPQVSVISTTGEVTKTQVAVPSVLVAPIRPDLVNDVHTSMRKNARQAYAVSEAAGHQHSAHSWGTGRAVSRIPRVSGGGNSRSGQAAFGNMCRKGRMFAPTKTWRKWHIKVNQNQRRYAVASALAASAIPALVMARGHKVSQVNEIPVVVNNDINKVQKTSEAVSILKAVGAYDDVTRVKNTKGLRAGKGKYRNGRRYVSRRGPLVVYDGNGDLAKAFRNIAGVECANVERLNLLQLAPGGHMGRFVIWTESAFNKLNDVFGSETRESTQKKGYTIPRNIVSNSDISRVINSEAVQARVNPAKKVYAAHNRQKKNPLKNLGAKIKLNPYAAAYRRSEILSQQRRAAEKAANIAANRKSVAVTKKNAAAKKHAATKKANTARLFAA